MRKNAPEIIPPPDGWKPHCWYLVDVSYRAGNPVHRSLFYTGYLSKGQPAAYNCLVPLNGPEHSEPSSGCYQVVYLNFVKLILTDTEAKAAYE